MVERTWGSIMAAAAPWSARKATSSSTFGASPQASDVTVNEAMPEEEQAAAPERIAEPAAHDEEHGVRDGVAGHDQLQHAGRGLEVPVDGGEGHVDDEEVGDGEEHADQDGDQARGATAPPTWLGGRREAALSGAGVVEVGSCAEAVCDGVAPGDLSIWSVWGMFVPWYQMPELSWY